MPFLYEGVICIYPLEELGGVVFVSFLFGCFCFSSPYELGNQKETDRKSTAETCGFGVGFLWFICDLQPAPASY